MTRVLIILIDKKVYFCLFFSELACNLFVRSYIVLTDKNEYKYLFAVGSKYSQTYYRKRSLYFTNYKLYLGRLDLPAALIRSRDKLFRLAGFVLDRLHRSYSCCDQLINMIVKRFFEFSLVGRIFKPFHMAFGFSH